MKIYSNLLFPFEKFIVFTHESHKLNVNIIKVMYNVNFNYFHYIIYKYILFLPLSLSLDLSH